MLKIKWEKEEVAMLIDYYFQMKDKEISKQELEKLNILYRKRAINKGYQIDSKFRNVNGLNMQLMCISYIVTKGQYGLKKCNKLFLEIYDLYLNKPDEFQKLVYKFKEECR